MQQKFDIKWKIWEDKAGPEKECCFMFKMKLVWSSFTLSIVHYIYHVCNFIWELFIKFQKWKQNSQNKHVLYYNFHNFLNNKFKSVFELFSKIVWKNERSKTLMLYGVTNYCAIKKKKKGLFKIQDKKIHE